MFFVLSLFPIALALDHIDRADGNGAIIQFHEYSEILVADNFRNHSCFG